MCELPTLKKSKNNQRYNFDKYLSETNIFGKTDYLVGNLETVFAGKNAKYSNDLYSYNTPDSFAVELKKAGFNLLSTANNHALDRGVQGLKRTINILKKNDIDYIGTNNDKTKDRFKIISLNNIRIGLLSYTYGTNYSINKVKLDKNEEYLVNYFEQPLWVDSSRDDFYSKMKEKLLSAENRVKLLKAFGRPYNKVRVDERKLENLNQSLLDDIERLKSQTDIIILLMHSGGQFNLFPGNYTKELVSRMKKLGVNIIIGNHPHVVQKIEFDKSFFAAYSLGNYFISPDTVYLLHENLPLYSIVLHIDIHDAKVWEFSFSIAKTINLSGEERVFNTSTLYHKDYEDKDVLYNDCKKIYETFTNSHCKNFMIKKEYKLVDVI